MRGATCDAQLIMYQSQFGTLVGKKIRYVPKLIDHQNIAILVWVFQEFNMDESNLTNL